MRPSGVIVGGWDFVIAAYALTIVVLIGYTVSLWLRWRGSRKQR